MINNKTHRRIAFIIAIMLIIGTLGIAYYKKSIEQEETKMEEERIQKMYNEIEYIRVFGMVCNARLLVTPRDIQENPEIYGNVEYSLLKPEGFEVGIVENGIVLAYPSINTYAYIENLNFQIEQHNIDIRGYGFDEVLTIQDILSKRDKVRQMISELPPSVVSSCFILYPDQEKRLREELGPDHY